MTLNAKAQVIWTYIETKLLPTMTGWDNTLDYGTTVDEPDIDNMVAEKFGSYNRFTTFTIGTTQYRLVAKPLQNKNTRLIKSYGSVKGGGENKVNIMAYLHRGKGDPAIGFNLHIQVRKAAAAASAAKSKANAAAAASGDWQTA